MKVHILMILYLLYSSYSLAAASPKQINIIIIADLSDRNLSDKEHLPKFPADYDLSVISELLKQFELNVKRNLYINSKDRISFISLPLNERFYSEGRLNENALSIDMSKIDIRSKRTRLHNYTDNFISAVKEVYLSALKEKTIGADIWSFFKYELDKYIIKLPSYRNIVVLLTDGYLYFDDDYRADRTVSSLGTTFMDAAKLRYNNKSNNISNRILPIKKDFSDLEILMLGIDPIIKYSDKELLIIRKLWSDWYVSMKVEKYKIIKLNRSGLSISLDINHFIRERR